MKIELQIFRSSGKASINRISTWRLSLVPFIVDWIKLFTLSFLAICWTGSSLFLNCNVDWSGLTIRLLMLLSFPLMSLWIASAMYCKSGFPVRFETGRTATAFLIITVDNSVFVFRISFGINMIIATITNNANTADTIYLTGICFGETNFSAIGLDFSSTCPGCILVWYDFAALFFSSGWSP